MPHINKYKCSKCKFKLPEGWGYDFYVENDKGERILCGHPSERMHVTEVLGERASIPEVVRERTGFNSHCICLDCLHQFRADLGGSKKYYWSPYELYLENHLPRPKQAKDKRQCPKCKGKNVKTELEMVGESCPRCKEGVIKATWTGWVS